jgi:tritrans,polycis-undecaprenyl-diphosphate synthase [geranylgeranyl-diphosphate specific]
MLRGLLETTGIYKIYEKWLTDQVKNGDMPEHIGVVLDGNRRWAAGRLLPIWRGHKSGARKAQDLLEWCLELGIPTLTAYVFSTENFQRSKDEVDQIFAIVEEEAKRLDNDDRLQQNQVRVKAIGRIELLPEGIQKILARVEDKTKGYDGHFLNIAIAYGGRAEIVDAARKIASDVAAGKISLSDIDEGNFGNYLYTAHLPNPYPDLIVRTSGEERLSNFLLWQSAYSELCFVDVYWPEFRKIDLLRAIRTFQKRKRTYGY